MGNHRFRLSDMMPNAWFYKLKDMGSRTATTTKAQKKRHPLPPPPPSATSLPSPSPPQPPSKPRHQLHSRQSYHFPRDDSPPDPFHYNLAPSHLPDPPRKYAKKRKSTSKKLTNSKMSSNSPRLVTTTSVSADCSCRTSLESVWTRPDSTTEEYPNSTSSENESLFNMPSWSPPGTPCSCNHKSENLDQKFETLDLPPIITKKTEPTQIKRTSAKIEARNGNGSLSVKVAREDIVGTSHKEQRTSPVKKFPANAPGIKLRMHSPRIGTRKVHHINHHRKSVSSIPTSGGSRRSDGVAVVKSSKDPHRDFKESMVEMIMQNNIKASNDLEDLLACYLSLNSDEYHDMIIKVFKQIWFDTVDMHQG